MSAALSVVVVARDEERDLARCLRSVAWAADRVVVDSGSTDRTVEIARREGARVSSEPWRGYAETKNRAIDLARHDWVLSLDADEWLTPDGAAEIRAVLEEPRRDAYAIPRRTAFCGSFLDRAWARDRPVRLFRRSAGRFAGGPVHEAVRLSPGARCGRLREPFLHLSYRSVGEYVDRMNRYTDLAAAGARDGGRRASLVRLVLSPPAAFLRVGLVRRGLLDGRRGWIVAAGAAWYVLLREAKIWELERPGPDGLLRSAPPTPEDPRPGAPPRPPDQSG